MDKIKITDVTLERCNGDENYGFTFRKKIEVAKLLDKIGVSVSLGSVTTAPEDILLVKSIAGEMSNATLSVCPDFSEAEIEGVWNALKEAAHPRLQVRAALSTARMEYVYRKKAADMLRTVSTSVAKCRSLCRDTEFIAEDATRADFDFLVSVLTEAVNAGASVITLCDTAGELMPWEFGDFVQRLILGVPELKNVTLGVDCSDRLHCAVASAATAVIGGAREIKTSAVLPGCISLRGFAALAESEKDKLGAVADMDISDISGTVKGIENLGTLKTDKKSPFDDGVRIYSDSTVYTDSDGEDEIFSAIHKLGYYLDESDKNRVYNAFKVISSRKNAVSVAELDSIIASEAMQVPATYTIENYVVTTGNAIDILAHVKLKKDGEIFDGLSIGDGPIDAAFLAVENITGHHYELDDFQIQAISEGREAMGQTLVKLRSNGKVYSGIGTSTDIIGSGVAAYINALNKIIYEEKNQ